MSKLLYDGHEYSFKALFELHKKSPKYENGEVTDMEDGENFNIEEIYDYKHKYYDELLNSKDKINIVKKINEKEKKEELSEKYKNNTITKNELREYMDLIREEDFTKIKYDKFFIVNMSKSKPKELSFVDIGRFYEMVKFMSYKNLIEKSNNKKLSIKELSVFLEFNSEKTCFNFLSKLKKYKLIASVSVGGVKFIAINPAYAQRRMKVTSMIFKIFKEDLIEYFSDIEIKFLEMDDDDVEVSNLISLEE